MSPDQETIHTPVIEAPLNSAEQPPIGPAVPAPTMLSDLEAGLGKVRRVKLGEDGSAGEPEAIELPFQGTILEVIRSRDEQLPTAIPN